MTKREAKKVKVGDKLIWAPRYSKVGKPMTVVGIITEYPDSMAKLPLFEMSTSPESSKREVATYALLVRVEPVDEYTARRQADHDDEGL